MEIKRIKRRYLEKETKCTGCNDHTSTQYTTTNEDWLCAICLIDWLVDEKYEVVES